MDKKLRWLDSFDARGSDGKTYRVRAYEHLVRDPTSAESEDRWEATGMAEYRLAGGALVDEAPDGSLRVVGSDVRLTKLSVEKVH